MNEKYLMVYVVNRCIDCKACMIACKVQWNVPSDHFKTNIDEKYIQTPGTKKKYSYHLNVIIAIIPLAYQYVQQKQVTKEKMELYILTKQYV